MHPNVARKRVRLMWEYVTGIRLTRPLLFQFYEHRVIDELAWWIRNRQVAALRAEAKRLYGESGELRLEGWAAAMKRRRLR